MLRFLFLAFLIVPIIEIGIFIALGQAIGLFPTLAGIVVTALIGSAVIRSQGISLIQEIRLMTSRGQMPARQIADGFMLAISGALLMTPGYFTDAIGFLLLVPPVRLTIFDFLKTRIVTVGSFTSSGFTSTGPGPDDRFYSSRSEREFKDETVVDLERDNWRDDEQKNQRD